MSSDSKRTARCCRLIIKITWRGTVCKTISSHNLLTDAWTQAQFTNWHEAGKALEQIGTLPALANAALHPPFPSPSAKGKHQPFLETTKSLKISLPCSYSYHCLRGLRPQWIRNSEHVTTGGWLFLMCSVPNPCIWQQPQPSYCYNTAFPGFLCLLAASISKQRQSFPRPPWTAAKKERGVEPAILYLSLFPPTSHVALKGVKECDKRKRRALPLSHEAQSRAPCVPDSLSERSLGAAGSAPRPRLAQRLLSGGLSV